jgi:hypothetical protein
MIKQNTVTLDTLNIKGMIYKDPIYLSTCDYADTLLIYQQVE